MAAPDAAPITMSERSSCSRTPSTGLSIARTIRHHLFPFCLHASMNFFFRSSGEIPAEEVKKRLLIIGRGSPRYAARPCPFEWSRSGPGRRDIRKFSSRPFVTSLHALRFHAFLVHVIGAQQVLPGKLFRRRVIHQRNRAGQDARAQLAGPFAAAAQPVHQLVEGRLHRQRTARAG